jgi:hypothetical protein
VTPPPGLAIPAAREFSRQRFPAPNRKLFFTISAHGRPQRHLAELASDPRTRDRAGNKAEAHRGWRSMQQAAAAIPDTEPQIRGARVVSNIRLPQAALPRLAELHDRFSRGARNSMRAVLRHCDLRGLDFRGLDFSAAEFVGCQFGRADLSGASFRSANLFGARFDDAPERDRPSARGLAR